MRNKGRGAGGEAVFGSSAARAVAAERERLGVSGDSDEPDDWAETWGRRIGRALAIVAFTCLIGWLALAWASAQSTWWILTPRDQERVIDLEETRRMALEEASRGDAEDFKMVKALLEAPPMVVRDPEIVTGDWRCRTIKMGGNLPLTVYGYFDCSIKLTEGGLFLQKPTGSQRKRGLFTPMDGRRFLYHGTSYYSHSEPKTYGQDPEVDEVGVLVMVNKDRMRLELPLPVHESKHDVIEFVR